MQINQTIKNQIIFQLFLQFLHGPFPVPCPPDPVPYPPGPVPYPPGPVPPVKSKDLLQTFYL